MKESIHKYFKLGTLQWMSFPNSAPLDALTAIARDDFFDAVEIKSYGAEKEQAKAILDQSHLTVCFGAHPMQLKDKLNRLINSLDCIDDVKKYELLTRLDSMPKHVKLCHGNFMPENIILSDKGTYVVDWVAARQGNASADVGRTYLLLCLKMPEIAEKYLNLFCEKTNTSKKYVQDWLPIVAAARLTEGLPEEKDFLMKWLDVVAYE